MTSQLTVESRIDRAEKAQGLAKTSVYSSEIQNKLVEDNVCLPESAPSRSSISGLFDLGY